MPADIRELWQSQTAGAPDDIARRIEEFRRKTARRNFDGILASVFLVCGFIAFVIVFDNVLLRIGSMLTIANFVSMGYTARRNQLAERRAAEAGEIGSLEFYRGQLLRQLGWRGRRFWLRWLLLWPGAIIFFIGFAQARPDVAAIIYFELFSFVVIMIAMIPLNRMRIRNDERLLEELDRLQKESE